MLNNVRAWFLRKLLSLLLWCTNGLVGRVLEDTDAVLEFRNFRTKNLACAPQVFTLQRGRRFIYLGDW